MQNHLFGRCGPCFPGAGSRMVTCTPICPGVGSRGPTGPTGPQGPQGPTGPTGPAGTGGAGNIIPFSISESGAYLYTDPAGDPLTLAFAGFGGPSMAPLELTPGEWASGIITIREGMYYGSSFIVPEDTTLEKIYVMFSNTYTLTLPVSTQVTPFVCLAICDGANLVYTILRSTLTFTPPYVGGVLIPKHTLRLGNLSNLAIPLSAGTVVGILVGIQATSINPIESISGQFNVSGGILLS